MAPGSRIAHTLAVMSGKGGVGKSTIAVLLAATLNRLGYAVGVLDADITGPSVPRLLGVSATPALGANGIEPVRDSRGIGIMSLNLLLGSEEDPVIWRGPMIAGAVRQFWSEVAWGQLDYLVVDLPPGTGDAPLTVLESLPVDGLVMVSSPQDLAVMVVKKAIRMARLMQVPILGLVENMSGVKCEGCGLVSEVFGPSRAAQLAAATGLRLLGTLPLDERLSALAERGEVASYDVDLFELIPSLLQTPASEA